jgi:uncharacterized protein (TIGR02996 family)
VRNLDELRAAVVADPDDDAPREVLADALIEAGDPQGELIRVQLAAALDPTNRDLGLRERELVNLCGPTLVKELPLGSYLLRRGTIAAARMTCSGWLGAAAELRRRGPVHELQLYDRASDAARQLCAFGELDRLRALRIDVAGLDLTAIRTLAARLPRSIRHLAMETWNLGGAEARELAALPLRRLRFDSQTDAVGAAMALLESAIPEIDFTRSPLDDEGAFAIAESSAIGRRPVLELSACALGPAGAMAIAASPHLAGLRELSVDTTIGETGLSALARATFAPSLERLRIDSSFENYDPDQPPPRMTQAGLQAILGGAFPRLRALSIAVDGQAFDGGPLIAQLERLELVAPVIHPRQLRYLLAGAVRLRHLGLRRFWLDDPSVAAIVEEGALESVDLSDCDVPLLSEKRRALRRRFGWNAALDPPWEPWVQVK